MATRRKPTKAADELLPLFPVGARIFVRGLGVVTVSGHLTNTNDRRVVEPTSPGNEPDQFVVQHASGVEHVQRRYRGDPPARELIGPALAESILDVLRGARVSTLDELRARGLYDAKNRVARATSPEEDAELLRYWYSFSADMLDFPNRSRLHEQERYTLGECAEVLKLSFEALRQELRERYPAVAESEQAASSVAPGSRVQAAIQARKRKPKSAPLP